MKFSPIAAGLFKLDGGAMFGVVPKQLWKRLNPPDEQNMCTWSMTCGLIETDDRKILIDTGLGDKQDEKFRSHFEPHGSDSLIASLAKKQITPEDITDVFLTHFHFDHVGGAVSKNEKGDLVPTFPNATYWSNKSHYDWALNPNPREQASFLKENFVPLQEHGVLQFIEVSEQGTAWLPGLTVYFVNGHTEAMMVLEIQSDQGTIMYCADLMPSHYHIRMPYVMAYDIRPLDTLKEKKWLLEKAVAEDLILFYEHDPALQMSKISQDERGRYKVKDFDFKNSLS